MALIFFVGFFVVVTMEIVVTRMLIVVFGWWRWWWWIVMVGGHGSCDGATRFPEFACYKPDGAHSNGCRETMSSMITTKPVS